jgi:putative redox protein
MAIAHATGATGAVSFRVDLNARDHQLTTDEPVEAGGQNAGPTAVEMVAAALCACTATTLRMYAQRKGWDLQHVDVEVDLDWRTLTAARRITLTGALDDEQRTRLMQIADACPVHKLLAGQVAVTTT